MNSRIENPKLLMTLEEMWRMDQMALSNYEQNISQLDSSATYEDYAKLFKPVEERWDINKRKLDSIIAIHGWPGNKLVGITGAKISWAIPQHHPDVFFKNKCLSLIKESVDKGDVDSNHYAELHDRIRRDKWEKQVFGASMAQNAPYPIEDPSYVNQRRYELGLPEPIEVYAFYHGIDFRVPNQAQASLDSITSINEAQELYRKFEISLKEGQSDSAISYLQKAIQHYGDVSNDQLYEAAVNLAQLNQGRSDRLSIKILKVLIWRNWGDRNKILEEGKFHNLMEHAEWSDVEDYYRKGTMLNKP